MRSPDPSWELNASTCGSSTNNGRVSHYFELLKQLNRLLASSSMMAKDPRCSAPDLEWHSFIQYVVDRYAPPMQRR